MTNQIPEDLIKIIEDIIAQEELEKQHQEEEHFIELPLYDEEEGEWKIEI